MTSVLNLRRELLLRGHDVRVLNLSQTTRSFKSDGVTHIGSVGAGKLYPGARVRTAFFSSLVQDMVEWQPDVIHSQCEFSTFSIAHKIAKKLDVPIVHTYHTVYEDYTHYFSPNKKWGRFMAASLSRRTLRQTACVIAPTEKVRTILNRYGINRDIRVIPTGIDLHRFAEAPTAEKMLDLKKQLGIALCCALLLEVVVCNGMLKPLVARIRPCDINTAVELLIPRPTDFSFPSGHTAASFAAVSALYFCRWKQWIPALILASLISFSRLYLYMHYPSDIIAGILLGLILGLIGCRLAEYAEHIRHGRR